ncbi:MAG: hypothetical protein HY327_11395 [Chloroflexi bacterium]|nr:hypothetical protein [Chloroflexota bacterium]
MTRTQATAEIFWTAFRVLPPREKLAVLKRILKDKELRQTVIDLSGVKNPRKDRAPARRKYMTARELLNSDLIGMWKDRTDIGDSAVFARQLREQAQR